MTNLLISTDVTWLETAVLRPGDRLTVTAAGSLTLPETLLDASAASSLDLDGALRLAGLVTGAGTTLSVTGSLRAQTLDIGAQGAALAGLVEVWGTFTSAGAIWNAGEILGHGAGLTLGAEGLTNFGRIAALEGAAMTAQGGTLVNAGTIAATFGPAIAIVTADTTRLVNAGTILGDVVTRGTGAVEVSGSGAISGDLRLGTGADHVAGVEVGGDVYLGGGDDWLDARGGLVRGTSFGGSGADTFLVDAGTGRIVDLGGTSGDHVRAWASWALGSGFEKLTLQGSADLNGTGNALANRIQGNAGDNRLSGGLGADTLIGGRGDDLLRGGAGEDLLSGGAGADRIEAGIGADILSGGTEADVFVWRFGAEIQGDLVVDFTQGADVLDLTGLDAILAAGLADDSFAFIGQAGFSGAGGQLRYALTDAETRVQLDMDGDGLADAVLRLSGLHHLTASDFLL